MKRLHMVIIPFKDIEKGAQWLSGRVLDSTPRGRGFEPHWRHCVDDDDELEFNDASTLLGH